MDARLRNLQRQAWNYDLPGEVAAYIAALERFRAEGDTSQIAVNVLTTRDGLYKDWLEVLNSTRRHDFRLRTRYGPVDNHLLIPVDWLKPGAVHAPNLVNYFESTMDEQFTGVGCDTPQHARALQYGYDKAPEQVRRLEKFLKEAAHAGFANLLLDFAAVPQEFEVWTLANQGFLQDF
jgi:hypothetical protein